MGIICPVSVFKQNNNDMNRIFKTILAGVMTLTAAGASAQTSYMFDNPDNRAYLGVRVGLDISSAANGGDNYSNKPGFNIGAIYHIPLLANFYFEPGLSVFYNTFGTVKSAQYVSDDPWIDPSTGLPALGPDGEVQYKKYPYQIDGSMRNLGFRVPLNFGFHFDFAEDVKASVYTGPQFNASVLARYHQNEVRVRGAEEPAYGCSIFGTGGFKHFDMQWNIGVGLTYQQYYLGLHGAIGMTRLKDATPLLERSLRRNLFTITLGYNF